VQTFGNIDANTRSIVEYLGLTDTDRGMAKLPPSYCHGRSILQGHRLAGGSDVLDDRFAFPRTVLDAARVRA
jgi:hypothetical protein